MTTEHPILFTGEMVRAILDGRKTQTRRVVKPQPEGVEQGIPFLNGPGRLCNQAIKCPYGKCGDILWVRETWAHVLADGSDVGKGSRTVIYAADCPLTMPRWRPSIHMPRWASRITLRITSVKAERVQDIGHEDVFAEGIVERPHPGPLRCQQYGLPSWTSDLGPRWRISTGDAFAELWDSINAKRGFGWEANPWVWAITFERMEARR